MATYHVNFNPAVKAIFAGTVNKKGNKWVNKSDVTDEALVAVRELLLDLKAAQKDSPELVGYQWKTTDGQVITINLTVTKE